MSRGDSCLHGIDLDIEDPPNMRMQHNVRNPNVCRIVGAAIAAEQFVS